MSKSGSFHLLSGRLPILSWKCKQDYQTKRTPIERSGKGPGLGFASIFIGRFIWLTKRTVSDIIKTQSTNLYVAVQYANSGYRVF